MNVVLDDAEEVWVKDTKSRKVGERQTLGASMTSRPVSLSFCLPGGLPLQRWRETDSMTSFDAQVGYCSRARTLRSSARRRDRLHEWEGDLVGLAEGGGGSLGGRDRFVGARRTS